MAAISSTSRCHGRGSNPRTLQIDNDRVRVTLWRFPPRTQTGHHVHESDYVVVPTVAGVAHNVVNASDAECAFVEIETK